MTLAEKRLNDNLKQKISKIENNLTSLLNDKQNGVYSIFKELNDMMPKNVPGGPFDEQHFKTKLWEKQSDIWSKKLSKQIITSLSDNLSKIISEEIQHYMWFRENGGNVPI